MNIILENQDILVSFCNSFGNNLLLDSLIQWLHVPRQLFNVLLLLRRCRLHTLIFKKHAFRINSIFTFW